jgi:hypothetical protein
MQGNPLMLRFTPLLLLLIGGPALGMDMASMEAIINSCQKGQICSCPRAKVARIDKSVCGPEPQWVLDNSLAIDGQGNAKKFDKYNKCLGEVLDANNKIDRYNGIFESCQHPEASDKKARFTNLPSRPIDAGDGKTLNEQVEDVKAAERAQEQALREQEAARAAPAAQPAPTQAPSPQNAGDIYQYCKAEFMKIWPRGEFCYNDNPQSCGIAGYKECVRGDPNWRQALHYYEGRP